MSPEARKFRRALAIRLGPIALVFTIVGSFVISDLGFWQRTLTIVAFGFAGGLLVLVVVPPLLLDVATQVTRDVVGMSPESAEAEADEREALMDRLERGAAKYPSSIGLGVLAFTALSALVAMIGTLITVLGR